MLTKPLFFFLPTELFKLKIPVMCTYSAQFLALKPAGKKNKIHFLKNI